MGPGAEEMGEILQSVTVDYKLDPFLDLHKLQAKNWVGFFFNYQ